MQRPPNVFRSNSCESGIILPFFSHLLDLHCRRYLWTGKWLPGKGFLEDEVEGQQRHISICEGCFCSLTKLLQSWQRMPANAISSLPKCNWSKALLWQTPEINPVKKYRKYPPASFFDVWVFHFFVCCHGYFVKRGKRLGKWSRKLQFWLIVHIGDRKHSCSAFLERKSFSIRKFDFSSP